MPTTLWNWERTGYLVSVKMKHKILYRRADVDRLIIRKRKTVISVRNGVYLSEPNLNLQAIHNTYVQ